MHRSFNTTGPCHSARDYMLPAMARLPEVRRLVDRGKYFVVHAPRQTGKTTALLSFARELNEEGRFVAVLVSMEIGAALRGDLGAAEHSILSSWRQAASRSRRSGSASRRSTGRRRVGGTWS